MVSLAAQITAESASDVAFTSVDAVGATFRVRVGASSPPRISGLNVSSDLRNAGLLKESDLHDYQHDAIRFIESSRSCALFLGLGLGKTIIVLTALNRLSDDFAVGKVLVVAPLRVANGVWVQEVKRWAHLQGLRVSLATGDQRARNAALKVDADVYVINRENIPWLCETHKWEWDCLVIDESTSFKSPKTRRFKALRKVRKHINRTILLTGTPSPGSLLDLWAQLYLVDGGERLGKSFYQFRQRYFSPIDYRAYKWLPVEDAEEKIYAKIEDVALSMSAADHLDTPDRIDIPIRLELEPKVMDQYKSMCKQFLLEIGDDIEIPVKTAAVMSNKLLQFCGGAVYDEEGKFHVVHDTKIKALQEIVEDNPNENMLVVYNYKHELERLLDAFPQSKMLGKETKEIDDWNAGKIPMLLVHPKSSAHGINLQAGGAIVVWLALTWSLEEFEQMNARLHRQGQQQVVRVMQLIIKGGLDEAVLVNLATKAKTQGALLNYLKALPHRARTP